MGVPKFFRYISERYPCLSELVREYQLPEFDNMYLDMNGIIHMCSHPDDNNPHFRITEEKIFQDIFHYLEVLFRMIRPQKLFFMAIDGVAPRAKMNQQRGRRFRSAKDAEKQETEAKKKGETLPTEARFDSNCITPGTVFMARLQEQLKYFVTDKISNDPLWRTVKVILSGHETPGEGEHKIMDYIRFIRAQPGYDPNTRHCLYGLDADLIMLGLCSHEPHFSLLREEVKFGRKSTKRQSVPEEITFFLLHLSLMREYLELEFAPVKDKLLGFEYDFEKIIDDWVLMGFLVGNDFIPHLPNLHIANGALPILYKAYMEVLPTLDGYINEGGTLNLARFEKFMQKLGNIDVENFEEIRDDLLYMEAKTGRQYNAHFKVSNGRDLEEWVPSKSENGVAFESLEPEKDKPLGMDAGLAALIKDADDLCLESDDDDDYERDEDEDSAFENYKKEYYRSKLEYAQVTPGVMRDQAEGYVRAIQWNLNYYYNGVCSWSWFYPHHYAPYISDIKGFTDFKVDFDLGTPFKPYEQLLGVLPAASKNLLPRAYHHLMTSEESPLIKYYPEEFQTDLNGKKQDWEAVVLIPFMDEKELLEAMKPCNLQLTEEERNRNCHGPMLEYTYTEQDLGKYDAPGYFSPIKHNHCKANPIPIESIRVPREKLVKGAYPGVSMNVYYPGFPTMKHLKYKAELKKAKVKVFEQPSRYENMIIKIIQEEEQDEDDVPTELLGTCVFVGWPHLIEARVVAISNSKEKYIGMGGPHQYNVEEMENKNLFKAEYGGIVERYRNRLGIDVGEVKILCHVQVMIGRKYVFSPNGRLTLEKQFSESTAYYPLQTLVCNIDAYDSHHSTFKNIIDVFPEGASCFTLCNPYYGSQGLVLDSKESLKSGRIKVCVSVTDEPDFEKVKALKDEFIRSYKTLFNSASQLGMSHFLYSRITGSIYVSVPDGEGGLKNVNVGLDLKFNKKNKETPGYTRKIATTWYYTNKCAELVREYSEKFPEIFHYFSENASNDNIAGEEIFGDTWEEKIKALQAWLRNIPTYSIERQPCGSQVTEPEVVEEIEKIIDNFPKISNSKKVTMQIKPAFLYKPEIQSGTLVPDPKMNVHIFDRIVNTRKGFSVPFGLKGTIIAITESPNKNDRDTMFDVVFDKPFKDGMQLNCSPGRGYRLPRTSFINLSYGKRLLEERTGKSGSLMAMAGSAQKPQNQWHNSNGQKFFNQFMQNNTSTHQYQKQHQAVSNENPPQYAEPQFNQTQFIPHGSAFASFPSQSKVAYNNPQFPSDVIKVDTHSAIQNYMDPKPARKEKKERQKEEASGSQNVFKSSFAHGTDNTIQKTERVEKKEVLTERPVPLQNTKVDRPTVNTNYLKNLLKIGNSENKTVPTKLEKKLSPPTLLQKSNTETSSNVSFEMLAQQVANIPASVRLLTYYQSNGLGIPRYQYFQTDGKYKAQISLTNGELVMGRTAETKELATENVASDVLLLLMKSAKTSDVMSTELNESLPIPPKTWVDPPREKSVDRDSDQALKTALHNPFVPTQVIKRQKSRTNTSSVQDNGAGKNVQTDEADQEAKDIRVKTLKNDENKKENSQHASNENKRKQRKPRIAANFGKKK